MFMQQFKNNIKILLFILILTGIIYPGLIASIALIINNNLSDKKMFEYPIENPKYFFARAPEESASQIDPHINISMAINQVKRIAKIRKLKQSDIIELINKCTEPPQLGFLGETRINVLKLNQALDFTFKRDQ
jgi:K+-transporting ATPase c subunit